MATVQEQPRVVSASREIAAGPGRIFELIADPAQQPRWDGNDNLAEAPGGQRVRRAGEVFTMTLTHDGAIRETMWSSSKKAAGLPGGPPNRANDRPGICGDGSLSLPAHHAPGSPAPTTGLS